MNDLRPIRREKGLTQSQLAVKAGLSEMGINKIENGYSSPQLETQKRIEQVLGERVNWLKTVGLRTKKPTQGTWENVEQQFRKALHAINRLQRDERYEFISIARDYLSEFEGQLKYKEAINRKN